MRAVVLAKHGPPDAALQVRQQPDPRPGEGQVLVSVRAAGLNFADVLARVGLYPDAPKMPCVMGYEVAGIVEEVGSGVAGIEAGQQVIAASRFNGFAEKAAVDAVNVIPLPEYLSFEQGAALPVNYGTAFAAIVRMAHVRPGEIVLVHAAAGGVGIAALQLLRMSEAQVIGTASASKHEAIRALGANDTIDYRTQDVKQEVMRITQGRGVDVVLDALGEFRASYSLLAPGGRLVMYGASNLLTGNRRNLPRTIKNVATMPRFHSLKLINDNKAVIGLNMLKWWDAVGSLVDFMKPIVELTADQRIQPVVAQSFSFDRAADAHRFIQERRNVGKVVLTP
jgi:NADPH:quinone reductase-like Zn-dependent oxidoreductase